jgi:hypothetical protein
MKVFRPSRVLGAIFAVAGIPFALFGAGAMVAGLLNGRAWRDWEKTGISAAGVE